MVKRRHQEIDNLPAPQAVGSAAGVKQEDGASAVIQDDQEATGNAAPAVVPKLDEIPKLLLEGFMGEDAATVKNAVYDLATLCYLKDDPVQSKMNAQQAHEAGAHFAVIQTMKKWPNNSEIQANCCLCIQSTTYDHSNFWKSFAMLGGVEWIVTAMKQFPESETVQRRGIGALCNLFYDFNEKTKCGAERFVLELDGSQLIMTAMKQFKEDSKIQQYGCDALYCLSTKTDELKEHIIKDGAVTVAGISFEKHSEVDANKVAASDLLKNLFA